MAGVPTTSDVLKRKARAIEENMTAMDHTGVGLEG
jgi:hypothetical protein